jgi:hypothetical protein
MFNAALVSFGSFGIIHGLMMEARELFLLHAFRSFQPFNDGLRKAISTLDFSAIDLHGQPADRLHHFQVTFNPNEGNPPKEATVYTMCEAPWRDDYQPPQWDDASSGPGASGLELIAALYDLIPKPLGKAVLPLLNQQVRNHLEPFEITAPIRDIFSGENTQGPVFASGIGLPMDRALEAVDLAFNTYHKFGSLLPVLVTLRFVKGTKALLGFTKFEPTCVMEVDALNSPKAREFAQRLWTKLEDADIPFTMHWGKFNSFLNKARMREMYGENVDKWIARRAVLLQDAKVREVFTNGFMKSVGLAT